MAGQIEQDLLYLERQLWQLPDPDALVKRLVALEQQLSQSWATVGFGQPTTPTGSHPATISPCGAFNLPDSIPFSDPKYGVSATLDWDSSSGSWKHCASGLNFGGAVNSFALHYELGITGGLVCSWKGDASFRPLNGSCSDATAFNGIPYTVQSTTCPPPTFSRTYVANASLAIRTLYQSNTSVVTVGPVAPA